MLFSSYQGFLTSLPVREKYEHSDLLVSDLLLAEEGRLRVFYAPFDWANPDARVIILGITPGWTQMEIGCREARAALSSGGSAEDVCRSAKSLVDLPAAKKSGEVLKHNIKVAADAGIDCLKYNVQMVGITRTGLKPGRGGA